MTIAGLPLLCQAAAGASAPASGVQDLDGAAILHQAVALLAATTVGALLSLHPMRLRRQRAAGTLDWDQVRAQVLITVAGALMVVIVGDSMARAFGLVGIGSFVRFRTNLRNPLDTALLFLLIGLGMACGLHLYVTATVGTAFLMLLLCVVEAGRPSKSPIDPPDAQAEDALF